jgi:hypothetical protein
MACSEDLQLRRSSSLADILEIFDVDGQGHFNFDIGREAGEDLEVVESVDAERGRSRVRRGE